MSGKAEKPNDPLRRLNTVIVAGLVSVLIAALFVMTSCSPRIVERITVQRDTVKVVQVDSLWQYERDSIYIREKGDTVYQYVERIRYRDRLRVDTLVRVKVDSVAVERIKEVQVEKPLSWWKNAKLRLFPWVSVAALLLLAWTFRKTFLKLLKI